MKQLAKSMLKENMFVNQNITNITIENEKEDVALILKILPCALLIVGTIGNVLSLIVLNRRSLRKYPLTGYLICLSATDLLVLYTGLLPVCILNVGNIDIRNSSSFLCKVIPWMLYFSLDMSGWIMVSATLERFISVWKPLKVNVICTRNVSITNLAVLCIVLLLANGHFLFGFHLMDKEDEGKICYTRNNSDYEVFQEKVFPWVDLLLFSSGPFVCQLVGNTAIVVGLIRHYKSMTQYSIGSRGIGGKKSKMIPSRTIMLLVLSMTYLLFTLPISVFFLQKALWGLEGPERGLFYNVANLLYYVNTSINFSAYIVSWRHFRLELWSVIRGKKLGASVSTTQNRGASSGVLSPQNLGPSSEMSNSQNPQTSAVVSKSQNLGSSLQ